MANAYENARQLQAEGKANYIVHLVRNRNKVQGLLKKWKNLKAEYIQLWFQENRLYALNDATAMFDNKIEALTQLLTLLSYVENLSTNTPLPTPEAIKLSIKPNYDNYFTFWLISETFPIKKTTHFSQDFLMDLGGELKARPTPYDWQKYQSPLSDRIDFKKVVDYNDSAVIYAYATIESPVQQAVTARLGFDNPLTIILNGQQLEKPADTLNLHLKKGKNHLILKMLATAQKDRFSFYLPQLEIRNRKHKYQIIE